MAPRLRQIKIIFSIWLILGSITPGEVYGFLFKVTYTDSTGNRVSFFIETRAFADGWEISPSIDRLQGFFAFSSFSSLTILPGRRYTVERVSRSATRGHYVFTIAGGPELRLRDDVTKYLGAFSHGSMSYPEYELDRAVFFALHRIEHLLTHYRLEEIAHNGPNPTHIECHNPGGNQRDLYVHITPDDSDSNSSIRRILETLASELQSQGIITAWRRRPQGMRYPDERTVSVIISLPDSRLTDPPSARRLNRQLSTVLQRLGEAEWESTGTVHFQFGYSAPVSMRLERTELLNFAHSRPLYNHYLIPMHGLHRIFSNDNRVDQEPFGFQPQNTELRSFRDLLTRLRFFNLLGVRTNIQNNNDNLRRNATRRYFMVSSTAVTRPNNEHRTVPVEENYFRILDFLYNLRYSQPLSFDFSYFNMESYNRITVINFLLTVYISNELTNEQQEEQLSWLPRSLNAISHWYTNHYTWARPWTPVSLSLWRNSPPPPNTGRSNRHEPASEQAEPSVCQDEIYIPMDVFQRITNETADDCDNTTRSSAL